MELFGMVIESWANAWLMLMFFIPLAAAICWVWLWIFKFHHENKELQELKQMIRALMAERAKTGDLLEEVRQVTESKAIKDLQEKLNDSIRVLDRHSTIYNVSSDAIKGASTQYAKFIAQNDQIIKSIATLSDLVSQNDSHTRNNMAIIHQEMGNMSRAIQEVKDDTKGILNRLAGVEKKVGQIEGTNEDLDNRLTNIEKRVNLMQGELELLLTWKEKEDVSD